MSNDNGKALPRRRVRLFAAILYVVGGVFIAIVLIGLKLLVEHSSSGRDNQLWVFGQLQRVLPAVDSDNPIVLLDISDLAGGKPGQTTSRRALQEIIEALADQSPRAVAVDVDFSPYPDHYASPEDPEFFLDFGLDVRNKKRIPLFLAVTRTKTARPEAWLGEEKYAPLAVAVAANGDDTSRLPLWVKSPDSGRELKTMSYALALEYRKKLTAPPRWIAWAVEKQSNEPLSKEKIAGDSTDEAAVLYADRLVNYSKLDVLKLSAKKDTSAESVKNTGTGYFDKLVILGDVSLPLDPFPVPGRQHNEAGVLLEACATYTLIKEPLFEFTPKVRLSLDAILGICIVLIVAVLRYRNPDNSYWMGKQAIFIYVAFLLVIFSGFLLVRLSGVMWLDFLLVSGALFLHPKMEHWLHWLWRRLRKSGPSPTATPVVKTTILVLAAASIWPATANAQEPASQCQPPAAAVAVRITTKGNHACYVRDNKDAPPNKLLTTDAGKKQFRAGQRLSCDKSCTMVIVLCGTGRELTLTEHLPNWYAVLNSFKAPEYQDRFRNNAVRYSKVFVPIDPRRNWTSARQAQDGSPTAFGMWGIYARGSERPPTATQDKELEATVTGLLERGNTSREAKDYVAAEEAFLEAKRLSKGDARADWGLGNVYADQEKWKDAEEAYRQATYSKLDPELYLAFGFVLLQPREGVVSAKRLKEAERHLWTAALLEPENPEPFDLLYQALEKGRAGTTEMEAAYRRALKLNSHSFVTNLRLSQLLRTTGRRDEADKYLRKADDSARTPHELSTIAFVWESQLRYEKAERSLSLSAKLAPHDPSILYALGRLQLMNKHDLAAVQSLLLAVQANPRGFEENYLLGVAQLRAGRLEEAKRVFDVVIPEFATTGDSLPLASALASVADAYALSGELREAIRLYERSLCFDPDDQETQERLSEVRLRLGR